MKFKVDENLPDEVPRLLIQAGHDTVSVLDQGMRGADDPHLAKVCRSEDRVLLTLDLDFADIRAYSPSEHAGLIVLRLRYQDKATVISVVSRLIPSINEQTTLSGLLWIVDDHRIRERE